MFLPSFFNIRDPRHGTDIYSPQTSGGATIPTGGATPMPTETSSTPAWDPSSRTPLTFDHLLSPTRVGASDEIPPSQSSSALAVPPAPQHVLLNERLVDARLKATIDGGHYKKQLVDVLIQRVGGRLGIFHQKSRTCTPLEPHWVTPKHPHPSYDHTLLMVIQGEHCGKYVRRIAHLNSSDGVVMVLAVANHVPRSADTLTGETLQLAPELLCKAVESDGDKKLNKNIMDAIRKEFKS